MKTSEWVTFILALLGALAWIPTVYKIIMKRIEKTVIKLYPSSFLEVHENEYNSIFSIRIGVYVKVKDAFIENVTMELQHSNGDKRLYKWLELVENVTTTYFNEVVMPTTRRLNGIGYNLTKDSYSEPIIRFTNPEFRGHFDRLTDQLRVKKFYITRGKHELKSLELSEPFTEMCNVYKKYYSWLPGDYKATITVFTSDKQNFSKSFTFNIEETLSEVFKELNIDMVIDRLKNTYTRKEEEKMDYGDPDPLNLPMTFTTKVIN